MGYSVIKKTFSKSFFVIEKTLDVFFLTTYTYIIPLFEAGKKKKVNNYRPVSILTCLLKKFEKSIYTRLVSFFQKHSVIAETQYGFQNDKSASHAILDVLTNAYDNI